MKGCTRTRAASVVLATAVGLTAACQADDDVPMGMASSSTGGSGSPMTSTSLGDSTGETPSAEASGSESTGEPPTSGEESGDSGGSTDGGEPVPQDSTPPLFTVSVVDLEGSYDPETSALGALLCSMVPGGPNPYPGCFRPFRLPPGPVNPEDLGAMTFITGSDAEVHAAAGGFVDSIEFLAHDHLTHSDLYAIRVRLGEDSAFWHEYLQVKHVEVEVGDPVEPGDVLGAPGDYYDLAYGKVGFGVIRHQETFVRLCPSRFADAAVLDQFNAAHDASIQAFGPQWSAPCLEPAMACIDEACDTPRSFVPVGGDIDRGRRRYETQCAMCHGENGEGDTHDPVIGCSLCSDHTALAEYIDAEMPPGGANCSGTCAEDVAAFIQWEFGR